MNKSSLVSVIMTVYNDEEFLKETIESILNQSYKNLEFIIVDDLSTDNSLKIIKEYSLKDSRIKVITGKKYGRARALNIAIENSKGKYIANIDSDDPSKPLRIEKQCRVLDEKEEIHLLGTASEVIDKEGNILYTTNTVISYNEIKEKMGTGTPFSHSSIMMRASSLNKVGNYNETLPAFVDYELWIRFLKSYRGANLNEILSTKRLHDNQFFENGMIKKRFISLSKLYFKAIKDLKLKKINYLYLCLRILNNYLPKGIKGSVRKIRMKMRKRNVENS